MYTYRSVREISVYTRSLVIYGPVICTRIHMHASAVYFLDVYWVQN